MKELAEMLKAAGVRRVLVVDDAYDPEPRAGDVAGEEDVVQWGQFFEDLREPDKVRLRKLVRDYDERQIDELRTSDEFVLQLWKDTELRDGIAKGVFERFRQGREADLKYLAVLCENLAAGKLAIGQAGRHFEDAAAEVDFIIIDLFLGAAQNEEAIEQSISRLHRVISKRKSKPPLVLLMSRSSRLEEKRVVFRDRVGLFESAFRIIKKTELGSPGKLARIVRRLASHYAESTRLTQFVCAWEAGLDSARDRTVGLIRILDLPDLAQIRQLLLAAEGAPTGSYLVDVFDRVLQHEVERETKIIETAIALKEINSEVYPPPYVAGSPNLQALVFRTLFQNNQRLQLPGSECVVAFGDVLRRNDLVLPGAIGPIDIPTQFSDVTRTEVLAVMTPACDLQREVDGEVLLLRGTLKKLSAAGWSFDEAGAKTPVVMFPNDGEYWIKWGLKRIQTATAGELRELLSHNGGFKIVARLRESHALEVQQKLLSSLGRVGLIATMPGTFPLRVEVLLPAPDKKLFRMEVPGLSEKGGVCFVGRIEEKPAWRLVMCEDVCEAICDSIAAVDAVKVHADSHTLIKSFATSGDLQAALVKGVMLPNPASTGFAPLTLDSAAGVKPVGFIMRSRESIAGQLGPNDPRKTGVVLSVAEVTS